MKAFEKWKKEDTYSEIWGHEKHEGAELGWRAALEWVIEECQEDGWGDSIALNITKIEKELEEK